MSTIPQELNWVEKRAACTIAKVFNQLCDGITNDVETINSTLSQTDEKFRVDMGAHGNMIYIGRPNRIPRTRVMIQVVNDRLAVNEEWNGKTWSASIGLNHEGRCILKLEDGTQLEQWQFRKKALEGMFFGD